MLLESEPFRNTKLRPYPEDIETVERASCRWKPFVRSFLLTP